MKYDERILAQEAEFLVGAIRLAQLGGSAMTFWIECKKTRESMMKVNEQLRMRREELAGCTQEGAQ